MFKMKMICVPSHSWGHLLKYGENVRHAHLLRQMMFDDEIDNLLWLSRVRPDKLRYNFVKTDEYQRRLLFPLPGGILYKICKYRNKIVNNRYIYEHHLPHAMNSLLSASLKLLLRKGLKDYHLFVGDPKECWINEKLKFKCSVFDAMDNWLLAPEFSTQKTKINEGYAFANRFEHIYSNTKETANLFDEGNRITMLPNAANDVYQKNKIEKNVAMQTDSKIKMGIVGNLNKSRLDCSLVTKIASEYSDSQILIAGKVEDKSILKMKNIRLLGWLNKDELKSFYESIDVLLVVRPVNGYTLSQDSIAVYEALAAGVAVVSSPLHPALEFDDICYVVKGDNNWFAMINKALSEKDEFKQKRMSILKEHSWKKRYNIFKEALSNE